MSAATNPGSGAESVEPTEPSPEKREWNVFLVTTVLLIPGAPVAFVGAYGFAIWAYQMIAAPPVECGQKSMTLMQTERIAGLRRLIRECREHPELYRVVQAHAVSFCDNPEPRHAQHRLPQGHCPQPAGHGRCRGMELTLH